MSRRRACCRRVSWSGHAARRGRHVGKFIYEGGVRTEFDDRVLSHLQVAIGTKLRRNEPFYFTWHGDVSTGGGRTTVWVHAAASLSSRTTAAGRRGSTGPGSRRSCAPPTRPSGCRSSPSRPTTADPRCSAEPRRRSLSLGRPAPVDSGQPRRWRRCDGQHGPGRPDRRPHGEGAHGVQRPRGADHPRWPRERPARDRHRAARRDTSCPSTTARTRPRCRCCGATCV